MRTVVHLSDLHFGAEDPPVVDAVAACVAGIEPDVVAISGDFTQRARRGQFRRARAFLQALPSPQVVVPGNHDVPLYNLFARFGDPLGGYHRYITRELLPQYADHEIAVYGANTTRSFTIQDGGLRSADVRRLAAALDAAPSSAVKIIVCHHPFDPLTGRRARWTFPAPDRTAVDTLVAAGTDIFLTGHLHISYAGHTATRYKIPGRSAIVIEAGTATSVRARGQANGFNVLRIDGGAIEVERLEWAARSREFRPAGRERFERSEEGWIPQSATAT